MNPYVTDLKLSEELQIRGIVHDAKHWWYSYDLPNLVSMIKQSIMFGIKQCVIDRVPACTAEELLDLIPQRITPVRLDEPNIEQGTYEFLIKTGRTPNNEKYYYPQYRLWTSILLDRHPKICETKLTNALAKMLIWLNKEGYLK